MKAKLGLILALFLLAALSLGAPLGAARAQYGAYGSSNVTLSKYLIKLEPGQSATVGFTVKLVSGTTWGTTVVVKTSSSYISASASPSEGDPTFSGALTISASSSAPPGNYTVNVSATGDDPSVNTAVLVVEVVSPATTSTTTTTTTTTTSTVSATTTTSTTATYVATTSSTAAPPATVTSTVTVTVTSAAPASTVTVTSTATVAPSGAASAGFYGAVAAVIVIFIIMALVVYLRPSASSAVPAALTGAAAATLVPAGYLLAYDVGLRMIAPVHYYLLAAYAAADVVLSALALGVRRLSRPLGALVGAFSLLFLIGMLLDAVLGMPLSRIPPSPTNYVFSIDFFFGFGAVPGSRLAISASFVAIMLLSAASASLGTFSALARAPGPRSK